MKYQLNLQKFLDIQFKFQEVTLLDVEIDYIAIGKRVRTARLAKKMTQETLSNLIDVAPTYISSIENGHTKLSLMTLLSIAQNLDTTVDHLLYDNIPVLVSQFDADIRELTNDCTPQEKEFLLEMIKSTKKALRNFKPGK
jgi:transcriptional regulator with XRE-family HTH domain